MLIMLIVYVDKYNRNNSVDKISTKHYKQSKQVVSIYCLK